METSQHLESRFAAKSVSVLDMVLNVFALVIVFVLFGVGIKSEIDLLAQNQENARRDSDCFHACKKSTTVTVLVYMFLCECVILADLHAAKKLYAATQLKTDMPKAFEDALNWLAVQLVCFIVGAPFPFLIGYIGVWTLGTLVRVFAMVVVLVYLGELQIVAKAAGFVVHYPTIKKTKIAELIKPEKVDKEMETKIDVEK